jgi:reverse gyrase
MARGRCFALESSAFFKGYQNGSSGVMFIGMSETVKDATLQILKKIQEDTAAFRKSVEDRLERIEEIGRKQRRDSAGMLVMMRATAGDFDERVRDVEERLDVIEAKRS